MVLFISYKEFYKLVYSELIFLLVLFPVMTILSFFDRSTEYKNLILIIGSIVFFAWGRPFAICLIFSSVVLDWLFGKLAEKGSGKGLGRAALGLDLIMNLGLLCVFGHNYLFDGSSLLSLSEQILPIGMAFYTLRGFSYVYDVYKGTIKSEKNIFCLLTYMVSLHLMIVGPMVHYGDVEPQIRRREITGGKLNDGLVKIIIGLGKTVILAEAFAQISKAGLDSGEITTVGSWLGMISFLVKYYFIFTGLCDMAYGLGLVNGFIYPENYTDIESKGLFTGMVKSFNTTVIEFFEQIFGLNKDRKGVSAFVLTVLCGVVLSFWYEAKINFIVVGIAAALLICLEKAVLGKALSKLPGALKHIYQMLTALIIFGGVYFGSFSGYKNWFGTLMGINTQYTLSVAVKNALLNNITLIVISFCIMCPFVKNKILDVTDNISQKSLKCYGAVRISKTALTALVFVISIITLAARAAG